MNEQEATKFSQLSQEEETEPSSSLDAEALSEQLDDSQLEAVVGGDGSPEEPPQTEVIVFRKPV